MVSKQDNIIILNDTTIDKWSIREQLCLASVASCSEDQEWSAISCALKVLCDDSQNRPNDWFSPKNCAIQYSQILEDNKAISQKTCITNPTVPTPSTHAELLLIHLTEGRVKELRAEIKKEQEEYAKLYADIKAIQTNQLNNEHLLQIWRDIEKEQEMNRVEEMKLENQLREREEKKRQLHRSWRTSRSTPSHQLSTKNTTENMDVEEIICPGKAIGIINNSTTSPLLSSLLKSTSASGNGISSSNTSVRTTAPTITTLLTGGSIPNTNQPAIIPSHGDAIQLLTRPISGPPIENVPNAYNLLSPSQSAPTLSMLLERNKITTNNTTTDATTTESIKNMMKSVTSLADANNEPVPMDIEEDINLTKTAESTSPSVCNDGTDLNEEQQLLEVFKNIGNIDELDIDVAAVIDDEEVDFLKEVDVNPATNDVDNNKTENDRIAIPTKTETSIIDDTNKAEIKKSAIATKEIIIKVETISSDDSIDNLPLAAVASIESSKDVTSNTDNTLDDGIFLRESDEMSNIKNEESDGELNGENIKTETKDNHALDVGKSMNLEEKAVVQNEKTGTNSSESKEDENWESEKKYETIIIKYDLKEELNETNMISAISQKIDQIENNNAKENKIVESIMSNENDGDNFVLTTRSDENIKSFIVKQEAESISFESAVNSKMQAPPSLPVADTDDDSSTTDVSISINTRKDDKQSSLVTKLQRKSPLEIKIEDEMRNSSIPRVIPTLAMSTHVAARSSVLRKLRDRDRSESPMVDDDGTTTSDLSTSQRLRRRYSSTPVIESVPNSPASSDRDERELRASKKSLLSIFNVLNANKYAFMFQRILNEDFFAAKIQEICLRHMDLHTIKKNIESGNIRTIHELQRDILLMCQNALMVTKTDSTNYKIILTFQRECQSIREFISFGGDYVHKMEGEGKEKSSGSSTGISTSKSRSGSRKSLRIT